LFLIRTAPTPYAHGQQHGDASTRYEQSSRLWGFFRLQYRCHTLSLCRPAVKRKARQRCGEKSAPVLSRGRSPMPAADVPVATFHAAFFTEHDFSQALTSSCSSSPMVLPSQPEVSG